ncbi:hypothetical protein [Nocardia sp. NBC_00403]|uniref:hypothetical protein n=1 Tax=Nocardia sp. NBC_00403 TaxID=2975990 RepID=UPI002E1B39F5
MNSSELKNMLMGMLNVVETDADDNQATAVSRRDLKAAMMAALQGNAEERKSDEYTPGAGNALTARLAGPGSLNHDFSEYNS